MHEKASSAAIYGGAIIAGFSISDWGIIVGIVCTIAGLIYNITYKERMLKIAKNKGFNVEEDKE